MTVVRLRYIRLTRRQRVRIWIVIVLFSLTALLWAVLLHLRPILVNVATARCSNTVHRIVVAAVNDAVASGHLEYGKLVSFDKDADGHVAALRSDMAAFNRLQTEVADDVLARLVEVSATELAIPLGTLTGSPLLAAAARSCTSRWKRWAQPAPNSTTASSPPASIRRSIRYCWR